VYARVSVWPVAVEGQRQLTGTIIDITRQREAESRLRFHANHDPLTGLPNRACSTASWPSASTRGAAQPLSYAVLFLDLDGFKWVNDSLGHGAGDRLLWRSPPARGRAGARGADRALWRRRVHAAAGRALRLRARGAHRARAC
jgi:predicted signal transduction protein with EAL and GGDEF domain